MTIPVHPDVASGKEIHASPDAFQITPSDSTLFTYQVRGIYVGGAGDVSLVTPRNNTVVFSAVPVGTILPVRAIRVNSTGTTATLMDGLY